MSDLNGPLRVSDLMGKRVVDVDTGEHIGHAWDVRIRREGRRTGGPGEERWVVTALVITSRGALERFGFLHLRRYAPSGEWRGARDTIAWDRIQRIGPEAIEVRAN